MDFPVRQIHPNPQKGIKMLQKKINIIIFITLIFGFGIFAILKQDGEISTAEKRKLAQFPEFSVETLINGEFFSDLNTYSTDQFPLRQEFRTINAIARTYIFSQSDVNGIFVEDDVIFKMDYPLNEKSITFFTNKTNAVYEDYIKDVADNYYVSVIPDKTYFTDHLSVSADEVAQTYVSGLEGETYIDIFDQLTLESYYRTDTHWSQEELLPVMEKLGEEMNLDSNFEFTENTIENFCGVYHGQAALNIEPDTLTYLTNEYTETSTVVNLDKLSFTQVYDLEEFDSEDGYNLYLSGATPLTTITSPNSKTEDTLIIFRDSFGSSIAPLFLEHYREVILVDLRYMSSSLLPDYVDFEGADVLVLYSSLIINSGIMLK